jgi:GNAT superfamily N-acetyltransferase
MSATPTPATNNVTVHMLRDDLDHVPQYPLPPGYRFRLYRDGDDTTWTDLHIAGEPYIAFTPEIFVREFGQHRDALYDRMYFVETENGLPVATITAWWARDRYAGVDRAIIHWVLVHPDHRRRGLTKPMMTHAMARMAQDNFFTAMLGTSTGRTWALKVYLDFGFHPHPLEMAEKPEVIAAWQVVQSQLHHPLLAQWLPR